MLLGRAYFREIAGRLLLVLAGVIFLVGIGASIRASVPVSTLEALLGEAESCLM